MTTGTVKFFNKSKGYGFIAPDGGGNDAFVHISAVENSGMRTLRENQRVTYDLQEDRRGKMAAVNLKSADDAPQADGPTPEFERRRVTWRPTETWRSSRRAPHRRKPTPKRRRSSMFASVAAGRMTLGWRSPIRPSSPNGCDPGADPEGRSRPNDVI